MHFFIRFYQLLDWREGSLLLLLPLTEIDLLDGRGIVPHGGGGGLLVLDEITLHRFYGRW